MFIRKLLLSVSGAALICGAAAHANPTGGHVASGQASVAGENTANVTVRQSSDKVVLNWDSFSIAAGEQTRFIQPNSQSIALNRVVGLDPSLIYGTLSANGRLILINPNGLVVGPSGVVRANSFIATTANISDENFLAGNFAFDIAGSPNAQIINEGSVTAGQAGLVAFVAPSVKNSGVVSARLGTVALGAATKFTLDFYGDELISFPVDAAVTSQVIGADGNPVTALLDVGGTVEGANVMLSARAARGVVDNVISVGGDVIAQTASVESGKIRLGGARSMLESTGPLADERSDGVSSAPAPMVPSSARVFVDGGGAGIVRVSGSIDVAGGTASLVTVTGEVISLASTASIDASDTGGGGTILVGGGYQGGGTLAHASTTIVEQGAKLRADALSTGNGGTVVVWSDHRTLFQGDISARGGEGGGNGGKAEVSSKGVLMFHGTANLLAPSGATGSLLLDPRNVRIDATGATPSLTGTPGQRINLFGTADDSVLAVSTLLAALNTADVTVATGGDGVQLGDLTVATSIAWSGNHSLTLSAHHDIIINDGVTISNTGSADLNLRADSTGSGSGTVIFNGASRIDYSGSTGLVSIFYNATAPSAVLFSDDFNRADGTVGNGWTNVTTTPGYDLLLLNGSLTTPGPDFGANVYRSLDLSGSITVSADITEQNGFGGLLRRYGASLFIGNNGTTTGGYKIDVARGDENYSDSAVRLYLDGVLLGTAYSTFQFGHQIHLEVTHNANGTISGVITGDGNTFNFQFSASVQLPGGDVAIRIDGSDSRASPTTQSTVDNFVVTRDGGYAAPTDFSSHVMTNASVAGQLTAYMLVNSATDLQNIQDNLAGTYALGKNIDASETATWNPNLFGGHAGFRPIGSSATPFAGILDGQSHSIDLLTISPVASQVGLFVEIGAGGVVQNLYLTNAAVTGAGFGGAGILAWGNYGTVENVFTSGFVHNDRAGGLVDANYGLIERSGSAASVVGEDVGGLAFYNAGTIRESYAIPLTVTAAVTGGGLVDINAGTIEGSYATANIGGSVVTAGGLVGVNDGGRIRESYATGDISGNGSIGGLVGANYGRSDLTYSPTLNYGSIVGSYATGTVVSAGSAGNEAGGLVGFSYFGVISNSFATGNVSGTAGQYAGGLVGLDQLTQIEFSHASGSVVGGDSAYVGGLVGAIFTYGSVFQSYASGSVSGGSDSRVGGVVGWNYYGLVDQSFASGSVVGGDRSWAGGLVGQNGRPVYTYTCCYAGIIRGSYATGPVTAGADSRVGGLVGASTGEILSSYSSGAVSGDSNSLVGGLLGLRDANGFSLSSVTDSYWDVQGSGQPSSDGGVGLTTSQLATTLPSGFDPAIWSTGSSLNGGRPFLLWQTTGATAIHPAGSLPTGFDDHVWGINPTINDGNPYLLWQSSGSVAQPISIGFPTPATSTPTLQRVPDDSYLAAAYFAWPNWDWKKMFGDLWTLIFGSGSKTGTTGLPWFTISELPGPPDASGKIKGTMTLFVNGRVVKLDSFYGGDVEGRPGPSINKYQCVELIVRYAQALGFSSVTSVGDGWQAAKSFAEQSDGKFAYVDGRDGSVPPTEGAVVSIADGVIDGGHVGIVQKVDRDGDTITVTLFDQNFPGKAWKTVTFKLVDGRWVGTMKNNSQTIAVEGWANPVPVPSGGP